MALQIRRRNPYSYSAAAAPVTDSARFETYANPRPVAGDPPTTCVRMMRHDRWGRSQDEVSIPLTAEQMLDMARMLHRTAIATMEAERNSDA